ncbi:GIY-YIG nuclease family protein [Parasphingorhabdus sp. DH2-15]|uniref:GIY-YIG nuclease family protein n=1 Tax=Parasphingorhabdus sp. DH2-15 TaxID=3444112 RepID=UPI003F682F80
MKTIHFARYEFKHICKIEVCRNDQGEILEHFPQSRYSKAATTQLHKYGSGPFVKFTIPKSLNKSGVYIITVSNQEKTVNNKEKYVGETKDLTKRYNSGYGNISPRNCFKGGQETNCRLNFNIYNEIKKGNQVDLWFFETFDFKTIEIELRAKKKPEWNRV